MTKTYKQAIRDGKELQKKAGVVSLNGDDWLAIQAEIIAPRKYCLNGEALYNYIIKTGSTMKQVLNMPVMEAVDGIFEAAEGADQ